MDLDRSARLPGHAYRVMIALIAPPPVGWVSTLSPNGVANLSLPKPRGR
jgi:hypothetical protein